MRYSFVAENNYKGQYRHCFIFYYLFSAIFTCLANESKTTIHNTEKKKHELENDILKA